jgi:hypothetical protein
MKVSDTGYFSAGCRPIRTEARRRSNGRIAQSARSGPIPGRAGPQEAAGPDARRLVGILQKARVKSAAVSIYTQGIIGQFAKLSCCGP